MGVCEWLGWVLGSGAPLQGCDQAAVRPEGRAAVSPDGLNDGGPLAGSYVVLPAGGDPSRWLGYKPQALAGWRPRFSPSAPRLSVHRATAVCTVCFYDGLPIGI